jgi:hypothetical protein
MNRPGAGDNSGKHGANHGRLDHRAEGLIVVDVGPLGEVTKDLTSLVSVQRAVGVELLLENLFAGDNVGANGARDKISGVVGDHDSKFFFHGMMLVRVDEGGTDEGGHR